LAMAARSARISSVLAMGLPFFCVGAAWAGLWVVQVRGR
jgi:hypothetical protein